MPLPLSHVSPDVIDVTRLSRNISPELTRAINDTKLRAALSLLLQEVCVLGSGRLRFGGLHTVAQVTKGLKVSLPPPTSDGEQAQLE